MKPATITMFRTLIVDLIFSAATTIGLLAVMILFSPLTIGAALAQFPLLCFLIFLTHCTFDYYSLVAKTGRAV